MFAKIILFLSKIRRMGLTIKQFTFNAFQENTVVVHDGNVCVIIDPGCYERHEQETLVSFIEENNLYVQAVLLTHAHIDHVLGCAFLLDKYNVDFYLHKEDLGSLQSVINYAHVYGFPGYTPPPTPNKLLEGGETLNFGEIEFQVFFTPGHAPGHVVYYSKETNSVINGDVLFAGSFGRVDLPGGDLETLKKSIFETMFNLPEETVVYCGHGPKTTIGQEKRSNYILQF